MIGLVLFQEERSESVHILFLSWDFFLFVSPVRTQEKAVTACQKESSHQELDLSILTLDFSVSRIVSCLRHVD